MAKTEQELDDYWIACLYPLLAAPRLEDLYYEDGDEETAQRMKDLGPATAALSPGICAASDIILSLFEESRHVIKVTPADMFVSQKAQAALREAWSAAAASLQQALSVAA